MPENNQNLEKDINTEPIDGVEQEIEEFQPFDPEKISIETKGVTMDTCLRRLEQATIILNPDFQRNEVWTYEKKCRLIESLILKIPLPMFYVSSDEKNNFYVVDGLQRLSTIRSFVLGDEFLKTKTQKFKGEGFVLSGLEFWGDKYDTLNFNQLPINIQNRILETEFTFTIINPGTPEEVKRNVFKRINTGGEPLTSQEIRHALYVGKSTKILQALSLSEEFLNSTDRSVKSNRMMDRELILRFLSFVIRDYSQYPKNGDMDTFLSDSMRIMNLMPDFDEKEVKKTFKLGLALETVLIKDLETVEKLFFIGMQRSVLLFKDHVYRKSYVGKRRTPINKALFEVWNVLLSKLTEQEFDNLKANYDKFLSDYHSLLDTDSFNYVISRDSLKVSSVKDRYEKLTDLINKYK